MKFVDVRDDDVLTDEARHLHTQAFSQIGVEDAGFFVDGVECKRGVQLPMLSMLCYKRVMRVKSVTTCYLCGLPLGDKLTDRDHIPPDQFFAKEIRRSLNLSLITVKVHRKCNSAYKLDEQYFTQCFVPFLRDSPTGRFLYRKTVEEYNRDMRKRALTDMILASAKTSVGSIYLPNGRVFYDVDQVRIDRVVRKIVRGLHFVDHGEVLPPDQLMYVQPILPNTEPPDHFKYIRSLISDEQVRGNHKGIFAYFYFRTEDFHYWAMLLWDRIIFVAFYKAEDHDEATETAIGSA